MNPRQEITDQLVALSGVTGVLAPYTEGVQDVARWLVHGDVSPRLRMIMDIVTPEGRGTMGNAEELAKQAEAAREMAAEQHAAILEKQGEHINSCGK